MPVLILKSLNCVSLSLYISDSHNVELVSIAAGHQKSQLHVFCFHGDSQTFVSLLKLCHPLYNLSFLSFFPAHRWLRLTFVTLLSPSSYILCLFPMACGCVWMCFFGFGVFSSLWTFLWEHTEHLNRSNGADKLDIKQIHEIKKDCLMWPSVACEKFPYCHNGGVLWEIWCYIEIHLNNKS